ncbi:MAG: ABC transporter ATP-binding protein [Pseudomonadota bacterium]
MIEARALVKRFGAIKAVTDLSLAVEKGEVLGLLGPNGAGKSTTMKMLTGFLRPTSGAAVIAGMDVNQDPIGAKRRFGYLPEGAPSYGDMTAEAFLHFIAEARGLKGAKSAIAKAVKAVALESVLGQSIDTLSKGFRRRVGVAQALLHDPDVLILDEPTDGLDPNQKHEVRQLIAAMAPEKAIIISTHLLEEVDALCSRAIIIDHGKVVADGTPSALKARSRYHGAVALTLESVALKEALAAFKNVKGAAGVEHEKLENGCLRFTILAKPDVLLIDAARALCADRGWAVRELSVDAGRLDDVFRTVTQGDRAKVEEAGQ